MRVWAGEALHLLLAIIIEYLCYCLVFFLLFPPGQPHGISRVNAKQDPEYLGLRGSGFDLAQIVMFFLRTATLQAG